MKKYRWIVAFLGCLAAFPAQAEFIISSAIVEFTGDGPRQQDIEIISRSQENDYVVSELSEVARPGLADEKTSIVEDPTQSRLLVTPDKAVLAGGGSQMLRFVLLAEPDEREHIYRVAVKPVIKGVENNAKLGLKILVGYEVLVIIRPQTIQENYTAVREGKMLRIANQGNSNIVFQNGKQCAAPDDCVTPPSLRVYPGQSAVIDLPLDAQASYAIWNGKENLQKTF